MKIHGIKHYSRSTIFIYLSLITDYSFQCMETYQTLPNFDLMIEAKMSNLINYYKINELSNKRDIEEKLIAEQHFSWINKKNNRQINWLHNKIIKTLATGNSFYYGETVLPEISMENIGSVLKVENAIMEINIKNSINLILTKIGHIEKIKIIYAIIDFIKVDAAEKIRWLNEIKREWATIAAADKIFDWFKDKDSFYYEIAWGYIQSDYPYLSTAHNPIQNHEELVAIFDNTTVTKNDKKYFVEQVRRVINQKKYRAGLINRKQYNFILDNNIIKKLDLLAKEKNMTRPQVIEKIIEMEFTNKIYLK